MTPLITCYFLDLIPPGMVERTVNSWFSYWFSKPPNAHPLERFDMEDSIASLHLQTVASMKVIKVRV